MFSWWIAPGEVEALSALVELHQRRHPEIRMFNAASASGQNARQVLTRRLAEDDPPDLFQGNTHDLRAFVEANPGRLEPLDVQFDALDLRSRVFPEVLEDLTIDGQLMAMPVNLHRENALFYNRALFDRFGLAPPTTIEELLIACETLQAGGVVPIATSHQRWITRIMFNSIAMGVLGGDRYVQVFTGEEEVQGSGLREAIAIFSTLLEHYVNPDADEAGFGWTHAASAVFNGDAAMFFHGDWAKGYYQQLGWEPGRDFGVVGAPGTADVFLYGADALSVPTGAANGGGARAFLDTVASIEGQLAFNAIKGSSSFRTDIDSDTLDPLARETLRDLERARHRLLARSRPEWDAAFERFTKDRDEAKFYQSFVDHPPLRAASRP